MRNIWANKTEEERKAIAAKGVATKKANKLKKDALRNEAIAYAGGLKEKIDILEKKLDQLQRTELFFAVSSAITGKALLNESEIVSASLPWFQSTGVYFLIHENEVVYVGQSTNIFSRIPCHTDKKFDRYAFVPCDRDSLNKIESLYIHTLRPKLNGNQANGAKCSPIPLDVLIGNVSVTSLEY